MSILMANIDENHMVPSGQPYAFDAYPFSVSMWMEGPNSETGREFVIFDATSGGNDNLQITLRNDAADTPASYTSVAIESTVAQGSRNVPDWEGDLIPLSGWTHFIYEVVDANTHNLYINNSAQTATTTNFPQTFFGAADEDLDAWYFFGRIGGGGPGVQAKFAGLVVADRQFTSTERTQLQSYWPSSIPTLTDVHVWDLEDDLLEASGGAALVNNNTNQYTLDGSTGQNPSLTAYSAPSGVAGIILGGG